ncbi:MAG: hypothetical protein NTZ05_20135, partial [Chloroflexi bacterium]|nr:hypothetical protein [Chloroflexota bacterium]
RSVHSASLLGERPDARDALTLGPVAQRLALTVPPRFAAGPATLDLALFNGDGQPAQRATNFWRRTAAPVRLAGILIPGRAIRTELPNGVTGPFIPLGDGVTLAAAPALPTASLPGAPVDVRLVWRADGEPQTRWNATVQLFDAAGKLAAQKDGPIGGGIPSDGWRRGEVREDAFSIPLRSDLASGPYRAILALYNPVDGKRLLLADGRDALELGTVYRAP